MSFIFSKPEIPVNEVAIQKFFGPWAFGLLDTSTNSVGYPGRFSIFLKITFLLIMSLQKNFLS